MNTSNSFLVQGMGAAMAAIPLFITPIVMKTAGGVLNRFGGIVNNPNKGAFDRMKKGAEGFRKNRQTLRDTRALNGEKRFGGGVVRMKARRSAINKNREQEYNRATVGAIAETATSDDVSRTQKALGWASRGKLGNKSEGELFRGQIAAGGGAGSDDRAYANAKNALKELELGEVKAAHATIDQLDLGDKIDPATGRHPENSAMSIALNEENKHSAAKVAAAIEKVMQAGNAQLANKVIDRHASAAPTNSEQSMIRNTLGNALAQSGPAYAKGGAAAAIQSGAAMSSSAMVDKAITDGKYSMDSIAGAGKEELQVLYDSLRGRNDAAKAKFVSDAGAVLTHDELKTKIGKTTNEVTAISRL
ncbi:MAG: hypothetical protein EOP06_10275 [Proteobacteria bacterium]|nr:MAG: hypothetical protein EOP06_10275 [Pseudomonadota bacterium]